MEVSASLWVAENYLVNTSTLVARLYFQRDSRGIPYILVLSCLTHQNEVSLCHQKTENEQTLTPK